MAHARSLVLTLTQNLKCFFLFANKCQQQLYSSKSCSSCSNVLLGKDPIALANALSLSAKSKSLILGTQIHSHAIKLGFSGDIFTQNNLIKMYLKCGVLSNGLKMFNGMPERNLVSWTLIISGAVQNCEFVFGLESYLNMTTNGFMPNEFALGSVMKACACVGAAELGMSLHCFSLKIGMEKNPFVGSSILNMYVKVGDIEAAEQVFEFVDNLDVGCWNAMLGGYAQCGCGFESLKCLSLMHCHGINMDEVTFVNALKGCSVIGNLEFGRQIHGLIVRREVEFSTSVMNALLDMYFKNCGKDYALNLFHTVQNRDVITWNTLFAGFSQDGDVKKAASFFHEFMLTGLRLNCITLSILFRICAVVLNVDLGLQFCCLALQFGFFNEADVMSSLVNMLSKCGEMETARLVFDSVPFKPIFIWNEIISGYSLNCLSKEALELFCDLRRSGVEANECTFSCILEICCKSENQQMGRLLHGTIIKSGFAFYGYVCSSLIKIYTNFGLLGDSFEFFNELERFDLATWGSMISALVHQGFHHEAIELLNCLKEANKKPDEFILGSVLNGCAMTSALHLSKSVHSLVIKTGFEIHVFVASAVIDAYAKCGDIESARMAFDQSSRSSDVVLFNTMIMAYVHHGHVLEAIEIFESMEFNGVQPNVSTFVSVISACSHMGLVDQGRLIFEMINLNYGMEPSPDLYGCFVDMLSRNGLVEDAKHTIEMMPFPPWPAIWRSLLNGCRIHGNREVGEWAAKKLIQLVPKNDAAYVLLSKVYSEAGSWEDAARVRKGMIESRIQKEVGCSWILV